MSADVSDVHSELAAARETIRRLNRRCQSAERGLGQKIEEMQRAGSSLGRGLANSAASMYWARLTEIASLVGVRASPAASDAIVEGVRAALAAVSAPSLPEHEGGAAPCPRWGTCFSHNCTCYPPPAVSDRGDEREHGEEYWKARTAQAATPDYQQTGDEWNVVHWLESYRERGSWSVGINAAIRCVRDLAHAEWLVRKDRDNLAARLRTLEQERDEAVRELDEVKQERDAIAASREEFKEIASAAHAHVSRELAEVRAQLNAESKRLEYLCREGFLWGMHRPAFLPCTLPELREKIDAERLAVSPQEPASPVNSVAS